MHANLREPCRVDSSEAKQKNAAEVMMTVWQEAQLAALRRLGPSERVRIAVSAPTDVCDCSVNAGRAHMSGVIRLFRDRPWTDEDSERFLDDPSAMKLDAEHVRGHEVTIANGCRNGAWLAEVVATLQSFGAVKIILTSAYPRVVRLHPVRPRAKP
jgi:hypothetical protein